MWAQSAVCGPLAQNVGRLAANVGLRRRVLATNLGFLPTFGEAGAVPLAGPVPP
jgi:hypothetical protein